MVPTLGALLGRPPPIDVAAKHQQQVAPWQPEVGGALPTLVVPSPCLAALVRP